LSAATFAFDSAVAHSGTRSLRVEFDGTENVDFGHVFQYIPVARDTRYHFSAFVQTQAITTDRGIGFEILDVNHPEQLQVATAELKDAVKITLRRVPSWKFDNKLSGTVWIDDVELAPIRRTD